MAAFDLQFSRSAAKEFDALPRKTDRQRVITRIAALADDPRPPGCRKLFGVDRYRIRVGGYRVVYQIDDQERVVDVVKIGHRKEVYRDR